MRHVRHAPVSSGASAPKLGQPLLQQTELVDLALDCELTSEAFPMARVQIIFERADQVDDTFKVSAADRRVVTGETAKGGDRGLELPEFFECLVMLAFQTSFCFHWSDCLL